MSKLTKKDVTSEEFFKQRRKLISALAVTGGGLASLPFIKYSFAQNKNIDKTAAADNKLIPLTKASSNPDKLILTPREKIISYNNFYEFGVDKSDPAKNAKHFKTDPWRLEIGGEVETPLVLNHTDLFKMFPLEERIYRFRCVEAWSMVVPWLGFELGKLIQKAGPKSQANYVAFQTLYDPNQMPGQKNYFLGGGLSYPYIEGLTIEEAMHPLCLLAVGLYDKPLLPQSGAPVRLVVPWKYGFKNIKSIVKITLTKDRPKTTWNITAPNEYGFYANVNPHVPHPRWSQAEERFIGPGNFLDVKVQPTLMFNGYADQVSYLYRNLDLKKNF